MTERMEPTTDRTAEPWGARTPFPAGGTWPERVDTQLADGVAPEDVDAWVPSASLLHSHGDAMDIAVAGGRGSNPQTLRQMRWALTMVKELSPQVLTGV